MQAHLEAVRLQRPGLPSESELEGRRMLMSDRPIASVVATIPEGLE